MVLTAECEFVLKSNVSIPGRLSVTLLFQYQKTYFSRCLCPFGFCKPEWSKTVEVGDRNNGFSPSDLGKISLLEMRHQTVEACNCKRVPAAKHRRTDYYLVGLENFVLYLKRASFSAELFAHACILQMPKCHSMPVNTSPMQSYFGSSSVTKQSASILYKQTP